MRHFVLIAALSASALAACSDDTAFPSAEQDTGAAVSVTDGTPHFANIRKYEDYSLRMANMEPGSRARIEEGLGFTSMLTYAEALLSDVDANEAALLARPEIFSYTADTIDDALMVSADIEVPTAMAVAANSDGVYYIGDVAYKVDRYRQAYVRGGDAAAAGRVLTGETEADGVNSVVNRYDLGESTLKSYPIEIDEIRGKVRNSTRWMDYSARIYITDKVDFKDEICTIRLEQKAKNFKKKHRRWREHHSETYFRHVNVSVLHPSMGTENVYIPDYFGGDNVNHAHTSTVKNIFKTDRNASTAKPYFNSISGTAGTYGINELLELNTVFAEAIKNK